MTPVPSHLIGWIAPAVLSEDGTSIVGDLRCPCGSGRLTFHSAGACHLAPRLRMAFAVLAECAVCGRRHILFDSDLHGWDTLIHAKQLAVLGRTRQPCSLPFAVGRCRNCGGTEHRGSVQLTVVPEMNFSRYAYTLDETQRIDAFTVIAINLECLECGQAAPAWARYETEGFAFTNPYVPLSMELTVVMDNERIGRILTEKRHRKFASLQGIFVPSPGPAGLHELILEMLQLVKVRDSIDSDEESDAAQERHELIAEEIAHRVHLAELPADLERFALYGEQVHITANDDMAKYARRHPPRCIRELSPMLLTKSTAEQAEEGADFRVGCPCGQRTCYVLGYVREDEGPQRTICFVSPLALECLQCGRVSELIDTRQHGHDGEQGCDGNVTGEGPRVRFPCPRCGETPVAAIAGFDYGGHHYNPFDPQSRPQDFFGGFTLRGECSRCATRLCVTSFETA